MRIDLFLSEVEAGFLISGDTVYYRDRVFDSGVWRQSEAHFKALAHFNDYLDITGYSELTDGLLTLNREDMAKNLRRVSDEKQALADLQEVLSFGRRFLDEREDGPSMGEVREYNTELSDTVSELQEGVGWMHNNLHTIYSETFPVAYKRLSNQ